MTKTTTLDLVALPEKARPHRRWFEAITGNILIQRDWRRLNLHWHRQPTVWMFLLAGIVQVVFCLKMDFFLGRKIDVGSDEIVFYYYFAAFHAFLQLYLPFLALGIATRAVRSGQIEASLVTPIPHHHIFWWLWSRSFFPAIVLVLMLYFALWLRFPWLYAYGSSIEVWDGIDFSNTQDRKIDWDFRPVGEMMINVMILALIALPWIKRKLFRRAIWVFSVFCLAMVYPIFSNWFSFRNDLLPEEFIPMWGTHAHFHPLVTIPYFLISAAWASALGVAVGLHWRPEPAKAILCVFLLVPAAELGAILLFVSPDELVLPYSWFFLYSMLIFYAISVGYLWMGIKWNLLIYLSRKKIAAR